ncbi:unnamed protein product [Phytophthora fragariaefolia]|uniref:Unnamed protein product n=1 Tax=Phytophthora fragariaefolia TaxID=1490495 RepID=A0A9W6XZH6_9STRA|nr:unnamed protein product [Phytophthora fragariaefolia]
MESGEQPAEISAPAAPPADAPPTEENAPPTEKSEVPAKSRPRKKRIYLPKGLNKKKYYAKKPGKARRQYVMNVIKYRKKGYKPVPKNLNPVVRRPWVTPEMEAAAKELAENREKARKLGKSRGATGFKMKEYLRMNPKERYEYRNKIREDFGLEPKERTKDLVPAKFTLPEGIDLETFLSKSPGQERMRYLARYIRQNNIDLEAARVHRRPNMPIGRKPEPRSYPRCGCSSSEACASCNRCVELHCACGLTGRQRLALCRESRACSCILFDPRLRCKLCHGCRQPQGFSHCRCVLHQKMAWTTRHPELEVELTEEEKEAVCSCFVLANRHGGSTAVKKKEEKTLEEIERVRRIRRATGFPSCDNIYRSKKILSCLGDEGLEDDLDDGVNDGPGIEILPPRSESLIPRTMISAMINPHDRVFRPASYHPLHRSEGCSLLETIEARNGAVSRQFYTSVSTVSKTGALRHAILTT